LVEDLGDFGKELFGKKQYNQAAAIYELSTTNTEQKNYLNDNVYYGISLYYANANKEKTAMDAAALTKADAAFDRVLVASPTYDEAYLYKGRINNLLEKDDLIIKNYQEYINKTTAKGAEELAKPATVKKVVESYNSIGAAYANTDKAKAIEYFNKSLTLDPTNAYATQSVKALK
jgi:tetratricopeptide (TPR) repeat protein